MRARAARALCRAAHDRVQRDAIPMVNMPKTVKQLERVDRLEVCRSNVKIILHLISCVIAVIATTLTAMLPLLEPDLELDTVKLYLAVVVLIVGFVGWFVIARLGILLLQSKDSPIILEPNGISFTFSDDFVPWTKVAKDQFVDLGLYSTLSIGFAPDVRPHYCGLPKKMRLARMPSIELFPLFKLPLRNVAAEIQARASGSGDNRRVEAGPHA
jgi:hypothetical protein